MKYALVLYVAALFLSSCSRPSTAIAHAAPAETGQPPVRPAGGKREIRFTGVMEAVQSSKIVVPQIAGSGGPMTLTRLIPNGSTVKEGDLIAVFDATQQVDAARAARGKFDDLGHQVEQKVAQNRADTEKRIADLRTAEGNLAKAKLEVEKGPVLPEITRLQNEIRAAQYTKQVESLKKSQALQEKGAAASLRILELQRDRQKVALDRAEGNIAKLELRTTIAGMVAHQNLWRNNSQGHAQEGDQLYRGQPIVSIFDPSEMMVRCAVGEPDGAILQPGTKATVYLDAYPNLKLRSHFEFASPVASSALGSPIKSFTAVFKLDDRDPHLMPDLSASIVLEGK